MAAAAAAKKKSDDAVALWRAGDHHEALKIFDELCESYPGHKGLQENRGLHLSVLLPMSFSAVGLAAQPPQLLLAGLTPLLLLLVRSRTPHRQQVAPPH